MQINHFTRFERRLYTFSFLRTVWFYIPVLVHHIVAELRDAGASQPHALAMSTLVIYSIGILIAEYPSGVFADWAGRKRALALSCVMQAIGVQRWRVCVWRRIAALSSGALLEGCSMPGGLQPSSLPLHCVIWLPSCRFGASKSRLVE